MAKLGQQTSFLQDDQTRAASHATDILLPTHRVAAYLRQDM